MKGALLLPALIASLAAAGCNPFAPEGCTLIGCDSALEIRFVGSIEYPFTISVTGDGSTRTAECTLDTPCTGARFDGFTPNLATVVYASASRRVERTLAIEYRRWRPNGDDCEPECLTATLELDLSA